MNELLEQLTQIAEVIIIPFYLATRRENLRSTRLIIQCQNHSVLIYLLARVNFKIHIFFFPRIIL